MKIVLIGYMGSGKSLISNALSQKLNIKNIDLDSLIESKENKNISDIFKEKGEIFFRKLEYRILQETLNKNESYVLAVGGGTPVYYNSIDLINNLADSFYLKMNPQELYNRLKEEKSKRPMISHLKDEDLLEFIAKHLFERQSFYSKAKNTINVKEKNAEQITNEIINLININK